MGLFDFLKSKKTTEPAAPAAPATPAAAPAASEPSGPRYKRPNYVAPAPAAAPHIPPMPPRMPPPMPAIPPFVPTNQLEAALLRAMEDVEMRPAFYQELLRQPLVVLPAFEEGQATGLITPEPGMEIQLQVLNDGKLPVFSSLERVYENGAVSGEVAYMLLSGLDYFRMVQGADCVLNPFSPYGKLLTAPELEELLNGPLASPEAQAIGPETRVSLTQPTEEPTALLSAVREFGQAHPSIEAVYLAQLSIEGSPEAPRLLLGFTIDNEDTSLFPELGGILETHLQKGQTIDLLLVNPSADDPLANYFRENGPIYQRA